LAGTWGETGATGGSPPLVRGKREISGFGKSKPVKNRRVYLQKGDWTYKPRSEALVGGKGQGGVTRQDEPNKVIYTIDLLSWTWGKGKTGDHQVRS